MVHHYESSEVDDKMALPTVKSEVLPHPDAPPPSPPPLVKQLAGEGPLPELPPFPPFDFAPPPSDVSDTAFALLISFAIGAVFAGALAYSFSKKSCNTCPL
tara:strand:- start:6390 stop:6692 length:303 start_codon:yes stop_codon:yes gene_type:complete